MIADGLRQVGAARSIVIDEKNVILAGNGVVQAAATAGITRLATWNVEQLSADVAAGLEFAAWFTEEELAALLRVPDDGRRLHTGDDLQPDEEGPCMSQAGHVYALGPHRLVCGDSTDPAIQALALGDTAPRLWIHDPPYDVPFGQWPLLPSLDVVAVWHRGKDAYVWMGETFRDDAWGVHGLVFTGGVRGQMNPTLPCCMHDTVTIWRRKWWEDIHQAIDGAVIDASGCQATIDHRPRSWQEHTGGVLTGHEGMSWGKPVLESAILMAYVPHGSAVWDPCAGAGSSLIAAATHGRIWRGAELQPRWADLIRRRWTKWAASAGVDPGPGALGPVDPNSPPAARPGRRGTPRAARRGGS